MSKSSLTGIIYNGIIEVEYDLTEIAKDMQCPNCGKDALFSNTSEVLYGRGRNYGPIWYCEVCTDPETGRKTHYVGASYHWNSWGIPFGGIVGPELREARKRIRSGYDALWKSGAYSISDVRELIFSERMGLPPEKQNINKLSVEECNKAYRICLDIFYTENLIVPLMRKFDGRK